MMVKSEYTELMAKIADGGKVNQKTFDELTEFAKAKKVKRPAADSVVDTKAVKVAKTATTPKEPKEPKVKAKCDPSLHGSEEKCDKDSRSNGVCAAHYSRLVYRQDEKKAEKVREASRKYAAKQRAEKAAQDKTAA